MNEKAVLAATLVAFLLGQGATRLQAQSAWMPEQGRLILTPGFVYSAFDEFWVGKTKVNPLEANDEYLEQYTGYLAAEYGISELLAADLTIGYTSTSSTTTFGSGDEGLADTTFGLRVRLLEESPQCPALALRVGGIIAGSYDENTPFSAGDGADGIDGALLVGKRLGETGFGLFGDIGYRYRTSPVPDEIFGSVGFFSQLQSVFGLDDALTFSLGYQHVESLSGLDIMGTGFNPALGASHGFPALREINQLLQGAVGYTDQAGRQYQFGIARSLTGRNTGDKLILSLSVSFPF